MEALQCLALKLAFLNERNKIDINEIKNFGPGFSFSNARFIFRQLYKEDEQSRILRHLYAHMELCCCGTIIESKDRNAYKSFQPVNHFTSENHIMFMRKYEYCAKCGTMELIDKHPCFNPICECGESYNILHTYFDEKSCHNMHKYKSARHHYYIIFGSQY
jgi:hypothetical protein